MVVSDQIMSLMAFSEIKLVCMHIEKKNIIYSLNSYENFPHAATKNYLL